MRKLLLLSITLLCNITTTPMFGMLITNTKKAFFKQSSRIRSRYCSQKTSRDDTLKLIPTFTSIGTVSKQCIDILSQLDAQPLHKGILPSVSKKTLLLENYHTARFIELLCNAARTRIKKEERWWVSSFSPFSNIRDDYGRAIPNGIQESITKESILTRCSLQQLNTAFDEIIHGIRTGWKPSMPAEHPGVTHTCSEKEYSLLVKPYIYSEEDTIIRFLADSLGLLVHDEVECNDNQTEIFGERSLVMLWIKKCAFDKAVQTLGIKE